MKGYILDFDDFSQSNNRLDLLFELKSFNPRFKATLFTPAGLSSYEFLKEINKLDWLELALHGWYHLPKECKEWDYKKTISYLEEAEKLGVFVKGFKCPMWIANEYVLQALADKDWWYADNPISEYAHIKRPENLKIYYAGTKEIVPGVMGGNYQRYHGHIQEIGGNGLETLYPILKTLPENNYLFISEIIKEFYGSKI